MKKTMYLAKRSIAGSGKIARNITERYKVLLIKEMKKMGANSEELELINEDIIETAIMNHRTPEDLAWAILQ